MRLPQLQARSTILSIPPAAILRNSSRPALLLTLLLVLWEALVLRLDYAGFLQRTMLPGDEMWTGPRQLQLVAAVLYSLVLTFLFVWLSLRSRWPMRLLCFLLFAFALLYEYSYYGALGRFSRPEDMWVVGRYTDKQMMADAVLAYISWKALVPITMYGLLLLLTRPKRATSSLAIPLLIGSAVLFYSLVFQAWYLVQAEFPTTALNAFWRTATYAPWKAAAAYEGQREPLAYQASTRPTNNVVFIVDESVRSDHLSLNGYQRPTTPYLEQLARQGLVYNWGDGMAGATCSHWANPLMLTGINQLPDTEQRLKRQPSIFQYAKAMGYTTYDIDSSNATFWIGTPDDLNYIDHWENDAHFLDGPAHEADIKLARRLRRLLAESTGNFVWVNKRGVHYAYNNTFPADQAIWKPLMNGRGYDADERGRIINSYDNGLRYNLEGFFSTLLADPDLLDSTVILYTADHGQTLSENGEFWSHCKDTYNEALVPIVMLAGGDYQVDTGYKASHANLFATLLDLMGYPESERPYRYALSLLRASAADSRPRHFFVGELDGSSPYHWVPFERSN